ncbi:hypothetical protein [Massilia luteola]|uniref:hypothetical protein n=1 Tax=Massilia luteola TaxID=3081751 RepID=UPI002ACC0E46|nr:hypothetical protein [Massilia sp. Gc5]
MRKLSAQFICLIMLVWSGVAIAQTTLVTCRLGKKQHETISVIAGQSIADSRIISLKMSSEHRPQLIFGDEDNASRGSEVRAKCVGKEEKVLVLVGEFLGAGYPRGVAVRVNKGRLEKIEFAERGLPAFVDLMPSEMRLAFSRHGPEIAAQFAIYTYVSGAGPMPEVKEANRVPLPIDGVRIPVQP